MSFFGWLTLLAYIFSLVCTALIAAMEHRFCPFAIVAVAGLAFWIGRRQP